MADPSAPRVHLVISSRAAAAQAMADELQCVGRSVNFLSFQCRKHYLHQKHANKMNILTPFNHRCYSGAKAARTFKLQVDSRF
ncbi:hypothetical protein ACP70R_008099 [Stipagrostis hirtigluma subsp. patula]